MMGSGREKNLPNLNMTHRSEDKPDAKDKATKERDADVIERKNRDADKIPDPPDCEPQLGDLTPVYIEWVKKYYPDDFEARYKGRIAELPDDREKYPESEEKHAKHRK